MPNENVKDQVLVKDAPAWMWGIGVLGLAIIIGSIGFMLYEATFGDSSPPDVLIEVGAVMPTRNGFLVEFRAVNEGGSTAQGLKVEAELRSGAEIVETSNTTIEYIASHSERRGGLFFRSDPRQYHLQVRAKGYESP